MAIRLKITLKRETRFVVLARRPVVRWCEGCGAESSFVDEQSAAASAPDLLPVIAANVHRTAIDGRAHLCLRSMST